MLHGLHDYASVIFGLRDLFCRRMLAIEMKGCGTSEKARTSLVEIFDGKPAVHC